MKFYKYISILYLLAIGYTLSFLFSDICAYEPHANICNALGGIAAAGHAPSGLDLLGFIFAIAIAPMAILSLIEFRHNKMQILAVCMGLGYFLYAHVQLSEKRPGRPKVIYLKAFSSGENESKGVCTILSVTPNETVRLQYGPTSDIISLQDCHESVGIFANQMCSRPRPNWQHTDRFQVNFGPELNFAAFPGTGFSIIAQISCDSN